MPRADIDKLVGIIMDEMEDSVIRGGFGTNSVIRFEDLANAILDAIISRAEDVRKNPKEWGLEESEYWQNEEYVAKLIIRRAGKATNVNSAN